MIPEGPDGVEDIHVTRSRLGGTLPGDLVDVEPSFRTRRGRLEGTVVRVVKRNASSVVGLVTPERTVAVWDRGWAREILLPAGGTAPGDLVEVRIRRYPAPGQPVVGEVTSVFGPADEPRAELLAVLAKYSIRDEFPRAALAQAEAAPAAVAADATAGREDLSWPADSHHGSRGRPRPRRRDRGGRAPGRRLRDRGPHRGRQPLRPAGQRRGRGGRAAGNFGLLPRARRADAARSVVLRHLLALPGRGPAGPVGAPADRPGRTAAGSPLLPRRDPERRPAVL